MKSVIIFLSGVVVGALGTALWTAKKLVPELREEAARQAHEDIRPVPDYSEYSDEEEGEEEKKEDSEDDIPTPAPVEAKKAVQENREAPSVDYSRYAEKKPEKKSEKKPDIRVEDENSHTGPVVIDPSEYDIRSDYRSHSYTIYIDGIIVDDDSGHIVTFDPVKVFGKTAMDELEKEDVVYVQDDDHKRYYRVEQMDFEYDGPDPEDEDDWGL